MSASLNSSNDISMEDVALGSKVIHYAMDVLCWGVATAAAWSCATLIGGIAMFIAVTILMALLTALLEVVLMLKLPVTTVAGLGHAVGRVTGFFARKATAAA